mmetsp:Transcript_43407/g.88795  ORF Transcript_43407/g.88795 Transcript_43407/m.88795 type:complete len:208 (+) Transcript_43407:935-1558(+)
MALPSSTARTMVVKLSSASTIFAAPCATEVPLPMATPMSAALSAGASLTPSPVIAAVCPGPPSSLGTWRSWTMSFLWMGSVREKREAVHTASAFSAGDMFENSLPVKDLPVRSSPCSKMPIMRQMVSAVLGLSPVMTMTRMPASLHCRIESFTSSLGGSRMPVSPMKVRSLSTSSNFLGSESRGSFTGIFLSRMACPRQRSAMSPEA